jgi:hypothetical protein
MRRARLYYRCAVTLSMLGMLTGQFAHAAGAGTVRRAPVVEPGHARISDIGLQEGGTLRGVLLDSAGTGEEAVSVVLRRGGEVLASTKTGRSGEFAFRDVSAGVVELQTPSSQGIYRLWAPRTAPPAAEAGILLVDGQEVVRGQQNHAWLQSLGGTLANPWVLALIVAAAIAIPLELDDDNSSAS